MSIHHGKKLDLFLRTNRISIPAAAKKVGVVKVTMYKWVEQETLSEAQIKRLKDAGINFLNDSSSEGSPNLTPDALRTENDLLKKQVAQLEDQVATLKDMLGLYKEFKEKFLAITKDKI